MTSNTFRRIWARRLLKYAAVPVIALLAIYAAWAVMRGPQGADIIVGAALLLLIAYLINMARSEARTDRIIALRIRAEYAPESQPELFALYDRLKFKELEYLFEKVLDDAGGSLPEARKLAALAQSIGWRAFLESRW